MLTAILIILIFHLFFTIGLYGAINGFVQKIDAGINEAMGKQKRSQDPRFD